jgi:hypothetical protein
LFGKRSFEMTLILLIIDFILVMSVLSLLS